MLLKYFSLCVYICLSRKSSQKVTWISLKIKLLRSGEEYILPELFTIFKGFKPNILVIHQFKKIF